MRLKHINSVLLTAIVLINSYILVTPLLPQVSFWWHNAHGDTQRRLDRTIDALQPAGAAPSSRQNSLIIPKMLLDQRTYDGPESDWDALLRKGIWRWPGASTPDKGGNTVFLAHRFSYTGPHGAFYYLDKLQPGDRIGIIWNNKTYTYKVISSRQVPPTETSVQANTSDTRVTLYTCTPLWHPVNRLVVVAKPEETP